MKAKDRFEAIGLAAFIGIVMLLAASGQTTSAAPQGAGCGLALGGALNTLQLAAAGGWSLSSASCQVTGESNGTTSGTFTGAFTSRVLNATVSGTWSATGSSERVFASSVSMTLSIQTDKTVDGTPLLGSQFQGMLSGTGLPDMFASWTSGEVSLN